MKKILKINLFLLIFFILFLFLTIFFHSPLKDKLALKSAKFLLNKFFKIEASWERLNFKIFPPTISFENFSFPYGKIEKISISPSYKIAHTKVFIYGMDLNLKSSNKKGGSSYGIIFLEDLILQKCKIRFEDKKVPIEGDFKDISLLFFKEKGLLIIKDAVLDLPKIQELKFSLKSNFEKQDKNLNFKKIMISSKDFKIKANGKLIDTSPSFSFDFNLNADLNYFLSFLKAGIGGECNLTGNISYKKDILLNAKGNIKKTKFLKEELPDLNVLCKLDSKYLKLDLIKEKNLGKIMLSLKENAPSEFNLKIEKINLKDIFSFFSIPKINYSKYLKFDGNYKFIGINIEKGEGNLIFESPDKTLKGEGFLKDFSIQKMKININENDFTSSMVAELPFNSDENFSFTGEIQNIPAEKLKNILSPFLPELPILKGNSNGNFNISGTYEDIKILSNIRFENFYIDDIPFGDGDTTVEIYNENVEFKNLFFSYKGGTLKGSGNLKDGITFEHKNFPFHIPFDSVLNGEGKVLFEPSFLISGQIKEAKIEKIFPFDNIKFNYNYDGEIFNLIKLEGIKEKGVLNLNGYYKGNLYLEGETFDFPVLNDLKISSQIEFNLREKDIEFCLKGLIKKEGFSLMPITFNSSCKDGNFDLEMENSYGFNFKSSGFIDKEFNFKSFSNFFVPNFDFYPSLKFEPSLKGEAIINGNFKDLKTLNGQIKLEPFDLTYKDSPFKIENGINMEIKEGNILLDETPVFHELAYIEISGNCSLFPKFKLKISGNADFGDDIVSYLIPQLKYDGMAGLNFSLEKTKDWKIEGNLNISGYKLSYLPINFNLLNPRGRVKLKENKIQIEYIEGHSGEGIFNLDGEILLGKKLNLERIMLDGESRNLKVTYIQGFTMFLDGKANFLWSEKSKQITGNLSLIEGNFTKELNLLSGLQKIITPQKMGTQIKNFPPINLNLNIDVPSSLKVKNQILNLICTGKIQILGDISNPIILGQLETLPKSEIYFNGVLYKIEYAKVLMLNPVSFDPLIELEATTNIRSYLIHLKIKGTLSHLTPQFSSEPYLTEADIISLLATGKVASQESGTWLSGASLLISQQISEELSKRSSSIFGLDRIRIEPIFGETTITTARITALKQINPNCVFSYTYNPIENQKDIISIECNVSQDTYLNLRQEEDGTYLLQIFQRKSL